MRKSPPIQLAAAVIGERIFVVRGQKVMLDSDLAALYGVTTGHFNQAVERNLGRFPADFMLRLTNQEFAALKSQSVISKPGRGGRHRSVPRMFTEHGAIMAASVLNSPRAIEMSVFVVRAFVELREALATHKELAKRLDELEYRIEKKFATHDEALAEILSAIRSLMKSPETKRRPIGFV